MPFDMKKAQLATTSKEAATLIAKALGQRVGQLVTDTVKLGIDTALTPKARNMWTKTRGKRWLSHKKRVSRLQILHKAGAKRLGSVYTIGSVAAATYGAEVTGMPPGTLTTIRATRLKLDRMFVSGTHVDEQMLLQAPGYDPALRTQGAPLMRYHRELWCWRIDEMRPHDCLNPRELISAFDEAHKAVLAKGTHDGSPLVHAVKAAHQVGWVHKNATIILDQGGHEVDLWGGSINGGVTPTLCTSTPSNAANGVDDARFMLCV